MMAIVVVTAWRWQRLLDRRATWSSCLRMAAIGLAGNQVLPFRGDAMRRVSLILAASPSGRQMLVGTSARRAG